MKCEYKIQEGTVKEDVLIFEADDVNDEAWKPVVECLEKNGFHVMWADGNFMNIVVKEEVIKNA